ncbi:MAG TPA: choice-of-anchor D domain-containing protein [Terracidiphilus sp.]|nr:choice-of-anchor D domain-containing protein [Terracidiphilus sp.]
MPGVVALVAALMLACAVGASAQAPTLLPNWNQLSPANNPGGRFQSSLTYDAARGQIVLFSGNVEPNDTWLWNGTNWTQAFPSTSPPQRFNPAMVFDAAHNQVVMFGGSADNLGLLGDTWVWDGTNWTEASTTGPSPRHGSVMVYDAAHSQVILFGGSDGTGAQNDTWAWNGTTWTRLIASSLNFPGQPSMRDYFSMVYDAAHSRVVMFGGELNNTNFYSDTWLWDGTSWSQASPTNQPPGRYGQGMAYDAALGQTVMFGGANGTSQFNDTWVWDGTNWTSEPTPTALSARIVPNSMTYDAALGQVVLYSGFNPDTGTWAWGFPGNFGNINVCPGGSSTPAPCSSTIPFTFSFSHDSSILSINVVTQGATGLDFTQANGGNCSGTPLAGSSCTLDVTFTPRAPGLRTGAVQLLVNSQGADQLTTIPIYGVGQGAVASFSPLSTLVENAGTLNGPKGVLVDAAGDLFVSDYEGSKVVEVGPSTSNQIVTIAQFPEVSRPQGLAMDGAGNLYVADTGIPGVVKIPWGCTNSTCQQGVPNPLGLTGQFGVSVDAQGDVFVSAYNQNEVVEVPVNGGAQTPVYSGTTPIGTAVDAAGDLFVADAGAAAVVKVPAGCTNPGCYVPIGSNWSTPQAVSLDAAGDLYVVDSELREVVEFPSGCISNNCQITIANAAETSLGSGFQPWDAVPDGQGNIYIADHGNVRVDVILQQFAALNFSASTVNNISGDSPQSVLFQNIGNQTLTAAGQGLVFSDPDFTRVAGLGSPADCTSTFSLAPGAPCNLSVQFDPLSAGPLTGNAIFYDNALNNPASSQSLSFNGTGQAAIPSYTLLVNDLGSGAGTVTDQFSAITCSVPVRNNTACSASYQSGTPITLTATPSAGASFLGWGGACSSFGTSPQCTLTMNSAMNVSASFGTASFGNINVCLSGGPAPCNTTMPVIFNFTASSTTVGSAKVVTQGVSNLDFTLANTAGSNCAGNTWTAGTSCTILVTFAPRGPGLRSGAVELFDNSVPANLVATALISGIGQAPEVVYGPAFSGATILGGPSLENVLTTTGFTPNPRGMTTDVAGNVYIADPSNGRLLMRAPNGTTTTVGTLSSPQGAAIDGAGNLFVADTGLREVVEIPAGCTIATCQVPVYASPSANPVAVVVDGPGDLFIADASAGGVVEVPAGCANSSCYVPIGSGWHTVNTLALDAAGDLFVPDTFAGSLWKMPAGCTTNSCRVTVGPGWTAPLAVALDAAGDLFVSDNTAAGGMGQLTEVPAGCSSSTCEIALVTGIFAYDLTVDQLGQVYAADGGNHRILQINQSQPPAESFATTNVGFTSTDSPQSFTLLNAGNQTLSAVLPGFAATGPNFYQVSGSGSPTDCFSNFSLAPGAGCNVSLSFIPQVGGSLTGTATATDNNLNAASATQTFNLSGVAFEPAEPLNLTGAGTGSGSVVASPTGINCNIIGGVVSGTCTSSYPGGTGVSLEEVPSAGNTFTGWGGACATAGTGQFCNLNTNIGSPTNVTASFSPVATNFAVTLTEVGTGAGTVSDNQSQISCMRANGTTTGTCSGSYAGPVILTATPTGNSIFAGWGDACAGSGANLTCSLTVSSPLSVTASFVAPGATQAGSLMPITAGLVYGQGGSFTSVAPNNGGVANGFSLLSNVTVDVSGNLYVADGGNNRVLFYPRGSTTPSRVYGQNGSFTSNSPNIGGAVSANGLSNPLGVVVDSSGDLYVADQNNNRVLFYPAGQITPTRVYGQPGFNTGGQNIGGISASSLFDPWGLAVDASGGLYVADYANSRVLYYPAGSTTATRVYGQNGSFTSSSVNLGGVSADSLSQPTDLALDASGDLYVADIFNNRVLFYPNNSTTATRVYGQNGSFISNSANNGGVSANSLNNPMGLTLDSTGDLYVIDRSNNRLLFYPFGSTTATRVYGQAGSFTNGTANSGGISANSLSQPLSVAVDPSGNLYVTDFANNRVLEYGTFGNVNVCPSGHSTPAPCSSAVTLSYYAPSTTTFGTTPQVVTQGVSNLDFTLGSGSTCIGTTSAGTLCVVNVNFTPRAPGSRMGAVTLYDFTNAPVTTALLSGTGQAPLAVFGPGTQSTLPLSGLVGVSGVAVDAAGNVFVSESAGAVKITPNGVQSTVPTSGLSPHVYDVAVDGSGDVFLADTDNNRVVEVTPGGVQTTVPATGLLNPTGVAVNGSGDVFITDRDNNRVVKVTPSGVQTTVPTSGVIRPYYPAVDAAGDLFFLDSGNERVLKITPGGIQVPVPINGLNEGNGVAVDAAGDVFVSDQINDVILEVTPSGVTTTVPTNGLHIPAGLAVDAAGNVYIADNGQTLVYEVNRSTVPSLGFANTNLGSTSSPQAVSVQNIGNQPLTGSLALNLGGNFTENSNPDCSGAFPLAPGATCGESFSFTPLAPGLLSGTAVFTDNALNVTSATQTINLGGVGVPVVLTTTTVPNVVSLTQDVATTSITAASLVLGTVSTASSSTIPLGRVISQNPAATTIVNLGTAVNLVISSGVPVTTGTPNPLTLQNNYFVTGDYVAAGVTLRGTGTGGIATGNINIPNQGVPDGADIIEAFLYWETIESTPTASGGSGTFDKFPITGQQIGTDLPNPDGSGNGTLRVYRADVNAYFAAQPNGIRSVTSSPHSVSLPDSGGNGFPLTEGASLVVIYRVLSPNFPLKAVVIYDGSALPSGSSTQLMQGFYDALGGTTGENTNIFTAGGTWNTSTGSVQLPTHASQYSATLGSNSAYAAVILSTPVSNSDNDGILDAWKVGPGAPDFHTGQPGYYDVKTGLWVPLPGAAHGQKDLFVQLDYMCGTVNPDGSCSGENLFPSPDATTGKDPLAMVQQAFAANGVHLHLEIGNAVQEDICADNGSQLCQFPGQPGVISWKNSLEFSKLWPRNLAACAAGGDCTARFPYGQKDSYHYVLFGHSLAIPAWNTRYGTLTSINVAAGGVTTIVTADRGSGINACPSRITISGVLGNPSLNGVYNTARCTDSKTITVNTPNVPSWSYPNTTLPEPVIGLTSGTITSISGYSDLGGADSAVTLGLWLSAPNQDMSKRANVIAGTLFHEIGHTLGLSHGGLYYDSSNYVPTFEANCKPNYQSSMNYLFQLDGVGPNRAVAFSNQTLTQLDEDSAGSVTQLTASSAAATFPTSAWYIPFVSGVSAGSAATLHCDGSPITGPQASRVDASIAPITPAWTNGQDINFDGQDNVKMRGFNDWANIDLRQVGATGGEYASLASVLSFGSITPQNIGANGTVALGSGGTVTLGSGGTVALGSGGTVTLGSGGTITLGSGGTVALGSGGTVTLGSGGTVTPGALGTVALGSGGVVTINGSGTITDGGTTTQVSSAGGIYSIGSGGIIALGSGGTVTLGSGGTVTLGSGGTVALGSGGTVTLGSGGTVTLGSGGTVALGSGGTVTLGSGGTVTLGSGGTVTLGSGGTVSGSGGTVALGSGGTVTLGSGGTVTLGSGGTVALGSGGTVTLGSGGTIALGSGGTITLGSGGTVTLGSGGTFTPSGGGTPTVVGPGLQTFSSGGTITLGSGGTVALGSSGGTVTLGSGGTVTLGSGGTVTLGSGGTVTLGSGGTVTLGSGGIVALGSGGTVALGSGGTVALGSGGTIALGSGGIVALGSGGTVTLGSGGSLATELTYETANSIVRPPSNPTETSTQAGVRIDWTAPDFGVVASYTIYRSSDGALPVAIGTVSGANGNPPPTEFLDIHPDTKATTVVYTIATNLASVPIDPTPRQSAPSTPAVLKNDQTITLGALPASALVSTQATVTATAMSNGVANGLQVNFSTTGPCSIANQSIANGVSLATVALTSTGSCTIVASQPGATTFNAATSVSGAFPILGQSQTQTISFTKAPPASAPFNSSFTVAATGGASGNPVTFTSSGVCTVSGATYTMTNSTGTCTVIANQAGDANFVAATPLTQNVTATGPVVTVSPSNINFGTVNLGSITTKNITVSNTGTGPVTINQPILSIVHGGTSNEFVAVNLCPTPLAAGKSCTITIAFIAGPFYTPQSATLEIMDNAPGSPQPVTLSALVLIPQSITFTTSPPASAANKSKFTVVATGGASGNPVTFTSAGACSLTGTTPGTATYMMNSGTGTCSVIANQAGNSTYAPAAQVTKTVTATLTAQTITFTTNPPASAAYKTSFTVAATGGPSGNPVKFTSSGACSNSGATYTMTSGTGTCSVIANEAGNSSYAAAPQVTKTVNATQLAQTITFTTNPPASAAFKTTFTVAATGGASGNAVSFTSSGACSNSGATYTMTSGTGTCSVIANQAGNSNYAAATQVTKAVTATYSQANLNPTSLNFGTVSSGKSSSPKTVTLSNTGTTPLIISSIGFTGTNPSNFVQTNTCPSPSSSLAAGKSCTISVTFKSGGRAASANLAVTDNTQAGTQTVSLLGD